VAAAVEGDQAVRPGQDFPRGPVVGLQAHDLGLRPILAEAEDVRHVGAPPAVDRLVVVAHHAQVAVRARQKADDAILAGVGVLVFVDEHVVETAGLLAADRGRAGQEILGRQQQVVEVEGRGRLQGPLVTPVGRGRQVVLVGLGRGGGRVRVDGGRLPAADPLQKIAGPQQPVGHADLPQHGAGHALLIAPVVDGEPGRVAQLARVPAQDPHAQRVERRDLRPGLELLADPRRHALAHLVGRLVGKRHAQDAVGPCAAADQLGDAEGDDAGLAGPCPGQHQQRTRQGQHGFKLGRIEVHSAAWKEEDDRRRLPEPNPGEPRRPATGPLILNHPFAAAKGQGRGDGWT